MKEKIVPRYQREQFSETGKASYHSGQKCVGKYLTLVFISQGYQQENPSLTKIDGVVWDLKKQY